MVSERGERLACSESPDTPGCGAAPTVSLGCNVGMGEPGAAPAKAPTRVVWLAFELGDAPRLDLHKAMLRVPVAVPEGSPPEGAEALTLSLHAPPSRWEDGATVRTHTPALPTAVPRPALPASASCLPCALHMVTVPRVAAATRPV